MRGFAIAAFVFSLFALPGEAIRSDEPGPKQPISSADEFEAYLNSTDMESSPFAAFSAFEFAEFASKLRFTEHGLSSFNPSVFADLSVSETSRILALFDTPIPAEAVAGYPDADAYSADLVQTRAAKGPSITSFGARGARESERDANTIAPDRERFAEHVQALDRETIGFTRYAFELQQDYARLFDSYHEGNQLETLNLLDLENLFSAASSAMFYAPGEHALRHQLAVFSAIEARGQLRRRHYLELQESYIRARHFDLARTLETTNPGLLLLAVPQVREMPGVNEPYGYWTHDFDANELTHQTAALTGDQGAVLVVFNPGCGFSRQAVKDIAGDPELMQNRFFEDSLWLIPPEGRFWTAKHLQNVDAPGQFNWGYAHAAEGWPEISLQSVPRFYFLNKEGQVTGQKVGWLLTPEDRQSQLKEIKQLFNALQPANDH